MAYFYWVILRQGSKCKYAFSLRTKGLTLICIYGDCNAILLFTSHFCSALFPNTFARTLFSFLRMLFFWPRLNILIFLPILGWKYSSILYYSLNIIAYDISVLEFIGVSITSVWYLDLYRVTLCMCSTAFRSEAKMSRQTTLGRFGFEKNISHRTSVMETKVTDFV